MQKVNIILISILILSFIFSLLGKIENTIVLEGEWILTNYNSQIEKIYLISIKTKGNEFTATGYTFSGYQSVKLITQQPDIIIQGIIQGDKIEAIFNETHSIYQGEGVFHWKKLNQDTFIGRFKNQYTEGKSIIKRFKENNNINRKEPIVS